MMAIDVVGNDLDIGDRVAFISQGGYTMNLALGTIEKITKQKVLIRVEKEYRVYFCEDTCYKFFGKHGQVVKIQ